MRFTPTMRLYVTKKLCSILLFGSRQVYLSESLSLFQRVTTLVHANMEQLKQLPWKKLMPVRPILSGFTVGCWLGAGDRNPRELPFAVWLPAVYWGYQFVGAGRWDVESSTKDSCTLVGRWDAPGSCSELELKPKPTTETTTPPNTTSER